MGKKIKKTTKKAKRAVRYTVDYFIKFFSAIPEEKWCKGELVLESGARCALGHLCGRDAYRSHSRRKLALAKLFDPSVTVACSIRTDAAIYSVNDAGFNPKQSILNRLNEIKFAKSAKKAA